MTIIGATPPKAYGGPSGHAQASRVRSMLIEASGKLKFSSEAFTNLLRTKLKGLFWIGSIEKTDPRSPHLAISKITVKSGSQFRVLLPGQPASTVITVTFDGRRDEIVILGFSRMFGDAIAAKLSGLFGAFTQEEDINYLGKMNYHCHRRRLASDADWEALGDFAQLITNETSSA